MKLKTVDVGGETYAEIQDGKPVFLAEDGKEIAFDVPAAWSRITRLNAEAKGHREAKEAAEARLREFDGLEPEKARKALETVANFDDTKYVEAGKVEELKRQTREAFDLQLKEVERKYEPIRAERDEYKARHKASVLESAFNRSRFVAEKLAIPADMVQSRFARNFAVGDDDSIQVKGADGAPIYSRSNLGEPAGFDEALEILVDSYPHRDLILKGTGAAGGGATGGSASGGRRISREQYEAITDPLVKAKTAREYTIV